MPQPENRRFLLVKRPVGTPLRDDFQLVREAVPDAPDGGMVVHNRFISLDPAQRGWMDDAPSYMPPIALGDPVRATTVGVVESSRNPDFQPGDWVLGLNAIEDFSVVLPGGFTSRIDVGIVDRPSRYLSAVGAVGLTAYFGLLDAGAPQPGETLLVTGAAGAVGSMVGQIGKIMGMRVIGIAGGAEKCRRLVQDYGFDAAIDYKGKSQDAIAAEIAAAAPEGIDILFENVGGAVMDAAMLHLALHARVVLCGLISEYNSAQKVGMRNLWQVIVKQATIKGFLIAAYVPRFAEGGARIAQWIAEGKLRVDEDVQHGLDNAYDAFMRLFSGANTGKLVLEVD
ncbi:MULTISPECIES: NADP-dependent oxidoreductase [unclassified Novosphingobium]|uniref:NADP-dependent oxidoreductase n=1 Tax=unclassified Novosphingobium TaxID=2644732 RepID=UPI00086F9763|nr:MULTISPECIES: NADP-dependent oxidoreductase [unclassified Novosphingobium]MBN9146289.1 NADP-dependent oxidoreductase [Novosphingobium sp.]ODU79278.1 MAG: NADP-dependent oxidoreductase [Novosphingobium sp. SCN 63-17]OJX93080.1 MAG: NADP-dependent oxidoreductase [Novosphingobium sp. 63-713]